MKKAASDYDRLDAYLYPEGKRSKRGILDTHSRESSSESQRNYFSRTGERFDRYAFQKPRKLFKSRSDKKILGVCGGLAAYFNLSSTVIRILFIIIFVLGWGTLALVYLILALVLPDEPYEITREHYLRRF